MDSLVHVPATETSSFWTNEKHVNYLNTMEASFVRTMFENKKSCSNSNHHHNHRRFLRLDRHLPDSSESTLDLKPNNKRCRTGKYHAPSDVMDPTIKRTRRRSSRPLNSTQDQVVPQVENESKGESDNDKGEEN